MGRYWYYYYYTYYYSYSTIGIDGVFKDSYDVWLGSLEDDGIDLICTGHIWCDNKAQYTSINDGLPQYKQESSS